MDKEIEQVEEQEQVQEIEEQEEEVKTYTDEDIDRIVKKKKAQWEQAKQKEIKDAEKLAQMTAEEQNEHLAKEIEELRLEKTLGEREDSVRETLAVSGYQVSTELVRLLAVEDEEQTVTNAEAFVKLLEIEVEKGINDRLKSTTPPLMVNSKNSKKDIGLGDLARRSRIIE